MMECIVASVMTITAVLFATFYYFYFYKKKPDQNDSSETRSNATVNRVINPVNKKPKKKPGKKGNQNELETGNNIDEPFNEVEHIDSVGHIETKHNVTHTEELIVPLKSSEVSASPDKKKKRNRPKHGSGDQVSTETRTYDENQSNTLLGRSHDEKLQDEIQILLKKLDDVDSDRKKNETVIAEIKAKMLEKEKENIDLHTKLTEVNAKMGKISSDNEQTKKELENQKAQTTFNDEGHSGMYKKYEDKLEQLNGELTTLNKRLKEETESSAKINKKFNDVNNALSEKVNLLKTKESDIHKFEKMNNELKKVVADLQADLKVKQEECNKRLNDSEAQKNKLHETVNAVVQENKLKDLEIDRLKVNESLLTEKVSNLLITVDELESKIKNNDKAYNSKISEMDDNNTRLQVTIHKLEKEQESSRHQIVSLEETNAALVTNTEDHLQQWTATFAIKEDEIKKRANECINELQNTIVEKLREMASLKTNEKTLENKLHSLNCTLDELKSDIVSKEDSYVANKNKVDETVAALTDTIKKLERDLSEKTADLISAKNNEELLQEHLSSLKEMVENLQKGKCEMDVLVAQNQVILVQNTQMESEIGDLKKQCGDKMCEIDELKKINDLLLEKISSVNCQVEQLKQRPGKVEEHHRQNANVDKSLELHSQIESLRNELAKKETQVKDLLNETSVLASDKEKLEQSFTEQVEESSRTILKLTKEISLLQEISAEEIVQEEIVAMNIAPMNTECDIYESNSDNEKIEQLKSHISKLERELKGMQGRYFVLKEDTVKVNDKEKHRNANVISDTNTVSIPPSDAVNGCLVKQDQHIDNKSTTHASLQEAIDRLNFEIEEQRLTNQKLSGNLSTKENEVIVLKQCLIGLDGSLSNIGIMANDLQRSCSLTQTEKNTMKCEHESLVKEHKILTQKYLDLEKQWTGLNDAMHLKSNHTDQDWSDQIIDLQEDNHNLRCQLEQYRESLEKTEQMLEKIQLSVDKEESDWKTALQSSELDCSRLEKKVQELTFEIDDLKSGNATDHSNMMASVISVDNGIASSESKKKRKRKNKKKKNKNRVSESNGV